MERYTQIAKSDLVKENRVDNQSETALQKEGWQKDDRCIEHMKKMQSQLTVEKNASLPGGEIQYEKSLPESSFRPKHK